MKKIITSLLLSTSLLTASAGDYLTNTNQHVAFLRNLARNSTTDIDAGYSNPAGMAFFKDGWQLSLNLAYFYTKYSDYTKASASYVPSSGRTIPGQDVYMRTNHVLGLGLDIAL